MKYLLLVIIALCADILLITAPTSAHANNSVIENALKSRPDLSMFYAGLVSTGVLGELREDRSYTVFAPTNDAIARFSTDKYPCFYAIECRAQAAEILRNHIIPGKVYLSDMGPHSGAMMSMYAINKHHIIGSEPYTNDYAIEGKKVLSEDDLPHNVLYKVGGVIADEREMSQFMGPSSMLVVPGTDLPPRVPEGVIVSLPNK